MQYSEIKEVLNSCEFNGFSMHRIYTNKITSQFDIHIINFPFFNIEIIYKENERRLQYIYIKFPITIDTQSEKLKVFDFLLVENISFVVYKNEKRYLVIFTEKDEAEFFVCETANDYPEFNEYENKLINCEKVMDKT